MNEVQELWRKINAYAEQFNSYIIKRANNSGNAELALNTTLLVTLHQAMALVLTPKCPESYQAQVDALKGTVDKVLDYLHGTSTDNKTGNQLNEEVMAGLFSFLEYIGRCAGFEVKITDKPPNETLRRICRGKKGKYLLIGKQLPQMPVQPPSPSVLEQTKGLVKVLTSYHNKLVEYILQEVGTTKTTLMALKGFEIAYLFNNMAILLIQPCPWIFTGDALEATADELKNMVRLLNEIYDPQGELDYGLWAFAELDYMVWRQAFLNGIAQCFGVDLDVELMPKGNGVELEIIRYGPLTAEDTEDSEDTEDFQDSQDTEN